MIKESSQGGKRGDTLTKEHVGEIWGYDTKPEYKNDKPFMKGEGKPLVFESAKRVLEQFDLGQAVFHPLEADGPNRELFDNIRAILPFECRKQAVNGELRGAWARGDIRASLRNLANGLFYMPNSGQEIELVVVPEALDGPDIWLAPKVPAIFFLSNALAKALKAAGVDEGWGLVRALVGVL